MGPCHLINGFACGASDWGALPKLLSSHDNVGRDVIYFDHRGIGKSNSQECSSEWAQGYSVKRVAQDVVEVLEATTQGGVPVHVLGISLGGMVAQQIAIDRNIALQSLSLGCTTHGGKTAAPPPKPFLKMAAGWKETNFEDAAAQRVIAEEFIGYCLPSDFQERPGGAKMFPKMVNSFLDTQRSATGMAAQTAALFDRFDSTASLASIKVPTIIVHGNDDRVMLPENGRSLAEKIPSSTHVELKRAGHFWWVQDPLDVTAQLGAFFRQGDVIFLDR